MLAPITVRLPGKARLVARSHPGFGNRTIGVHDGRKWAGKLQRRMAFRHLLVDSAARLCYRDPSARKGREVRAVLNVPVDDMTRPMRLQCNIVGCSYVHFPVKPPPSQFLAGLGTVVVSGEAATGYWETQFAMHNRK